MAVQQAILTEDWAPPPGSGKEIVQTGEAFEAMVRRLDASPALIFDFETSGTRWFQHARPCGLALGCFDDYGRVLAWYVPYRHVTSEPQLAAATIHAAVGRLLGNPRTLKIAHNLKFDEHMARTEGWRVEGERYDTMVAAKFYDENRRMGLKERAASDLGRGVEASYEKKLDLYVLTLARGMGLGKQAYLDLYGYSHVPVSLCGHYACYDIDFTGSLFRFYEGWGMRAKHPRIWSTEMVLTEALCDTEEWGLQIDVDYLSDLRGKLGQHLEDLSVRIDRLAGKTLELSKDASLREYLFGRGPHDLHLTPPKQTKTFKDAVDREVLEAFAPSSEVVRLIMEWRDAHKLASTYTTSILDRLDSHNVLHGELQQVGTVTGRMSSKSPNLQNFPSDDNDRAVAHSGKKLKEGGIDPWSIKRAFVNRGLEWARLYFDYSQIELRVVAHYTQDPIMVGAYLNGEDIHERTSLEVFGSKEEEWRRLAKVVNFGLSYGLSAGGMSRQTGIPYADAQKHLDTFFARYSGITTFRDQFWASVMAHNCEFSNLFGRRRRAPGLMSPDEYEQAAARRESFGSLIQGTAAELTKESMVRMHRWFRDEKIPAHLCTTIHDEIQIDVPLEYLARTAAGCKALMEAYPEFAPIPIVADGSYSTTNWAEKKKLPLAPKG